MNCSGQSTVEDYEWSNLGFRRGLGKVFKNGKQGFIDRQGNVIIPCEYSFIVDFTEKYTWAYKDDKNSIIDCYGIQVSILEHQHNLVEFSEEMTTFPINNLWGLINGYGQTVIPFKYEYAHSFSEGLARVRKNFK